MKRKSGFTLIELLMTVAIAIIIIGLAVPSFRQMIQNNKLTTQVNNFVTALNAARSEAIKRGHRVTVCKSDDQQNCNTGTQWENGWIVFVDPDNSGTVTVGDEIVIVGEGFENDNTLRIKNGNLANFVSFLPSGVSSDEDVFKLCDDRGTPEMRAIEINAVGRVSVEQGSDACP